jgi:hypothetical protein
MRPENRKLAPGEKRRGPAHPDRVAEWDADFERIAREHGVSAG